MRKKTRAGLFRIVRLVLTENTAESPEHSLISLERANWGAQPHYSYRRRLSMVDRDDSRCALAPSGPPPLRDGVVSHLRCSARTRRGSSPAHVHQHKSPLTGAFRIGGEAGMTRAMRSPLRGRHRCAMALSRPCGARLEPGVGPYPPMSINTKAP